MYDEDFVNEEVKEFELDGKKFSYKPATAGEENEWLDEIMFIDEKGRTQQRLSQLNKCKVANIKKVPYDKETIAKIIGVEKEWSNLDSEQKWNLLSKLSPNIFDEIFKEIGKIDKPGDGKKKD